MGPDRHSDAMAVAHVREMDFTGRPMKGFVYVEPPGLLEDKDLKAWVQWCTSYAAALPTCRFRPGSNVSNCVARQVQATTLIGF